MAGPINLEVVDTPIMEQTQFTGDMYKWLPNMVDTVNESFLTLTEAFSNVLAIQTANIGGGGAGPINVTVLGLTTSGFVNVNLLSSSNPVTITVVTVGTNQFSVTFNADPGASAIIQYMAFTSEPQ